MGACFLGILCAYLLFKYDIHKPLYLGNISLGIAVYAIGHKLKNIQFQREFLMMSLFVYFSLFYIQFYSIDFRANELLEGYYLLAVAFEFSGCLFINFALSICRCHLNYWNMSASVLWRFMSCIG